MSNHDVAVRSFDNVYSSNMMLAASLITALNISLKAELSIVGLPIQSLIRRKGSKGEGNVLSSAKAGVWFILKI